MLFLKTNPDIVPITARTSLFKGEFEAFSPFVLRVRESRSCREFLHDEIMMKIVRDEKIHGDHGCRSL